MRLHTRQMTDNDGEHYWIVFWEGEIAKPVAVLTDLEMKRFLREAQEEATR